MTSNNTVKQKATIYDVAKAAGVSPSAVSMTYGKRRSSLSHETVKHIIAVAKNLNYVPPNSRKANAKKKDNVAPKEDTLTNVALFTAKELAIFASPVYTRALRELENIAAENGFSVSLHKLEPWEKLPDTAQAALALGSDFTPEHVQALGNLPVVKMFGPVDLDLPWDIVTGMSEVRLKKVHAYLKKQDCTEFVLVSEGCKAAIMPKSIVRPFRSFDNSEIHIDRTLALEAVDEIFQLAKTTDKLGVYCETDTLLPVLVNEIEKRTLREAAQCEIAIVGQNYSLAYARELNPTPALLHIFEQDIVREAVLRLQQRYQNPHQPRQVTEIEPIIVAPE